MRTEQDFSEGYSNHLAGTTQTVVEVFSIVATGMTNQYYTDCDQSIWLAGITYDPYPIRRSKISFSTDLKPNEVELNMASSGVLLEGRYKGALAGATILIHRVNLNHPDEQNLLLFDGEVGATDLDEDVFTIKAVTLDFLGQEIPRREFQVQCNWRLYDEWCTLGLTGGWQAGGTFSLSSPDRKELYSETFGLKADDYYVLGFITINTGINSEIKRHVTSHVGNTITVVPPFPFDVKYVDQFDIAPGCKHDITDCEDKYNNIVNYGGFPWIPTQDVVL